VEPGDQLELNVKVISAKRGIWKFECSASVDGQVATTATILCADRAV
jgi:3-hydroxyacyl-[acyl-carrier-protein] dehydratase